MKTSLLTIGLLAVATLSATLPLPPNPPVAVIELFTSQGCSSCPPADKLLTETVNRAKAGQQSVYALSFHVDYWNRLGWSDPYSDARYSARQRQYAQQLKTATVYTPQAVINGRQEFVGSNRARLTTLLADALKHPASVAIQGTATVSGSSVVVNTKLTGSLSGAVLNVALVSNTVSTVVSRGENSGARLTHNNVVRAFSTLRATEKSGVKLAIPAGFDAGNGAVIAYLQDETTGVVLGAGRITLTTPN